MAPWTYIDAIVHMYGVVNMLEIEKRADTFTGQGSQRVGMWVDLGQSSKVRKILQVTDEIIGFPLSKLCKDGPMTELTETRNAQPAIVAHSLAVLATAKELHPKLFETRPMFCLGHSAGEYSALVAAGVIDIEIAIYLVRQRGLLMEQFGKEGRMIALLGFTDKEQVIVICRETGAETANFNSPGQIIISGGVKEIEDAVRLAGERRIRVVPLKTSLPFHSSLMRPVQDEFKKVLSPVKFRDSTIPVILNVTACPTTDGTEMKEKLVEQIVAPVRWDESITWARKQGVDVFLEFGPEAILTGLLRKIDPIARGICAKDYRSAQSLSF